MGIDLDEILRVDRMVSGHGRTDQLLSPIRIIVRMPELESLKVEDLSKSVKHAPQQATGHGMHCRETLLTKLLHVVVQRPGSFPGPVDFSVRRTVAELAQFSDFGLCRRYMHSIECPSSFFVNFNSA